LSPRRFGNCSLNELIIELDIKEISIFVQIYFSGAVNSSSSGRKKKSIAFKKLLLNFF
jgi:hypothetical protein